ncbi:hypothetical protein AB0O91_04965 [Kitasatospora sp. NPDC089797]|uniref:hypothetical protein n=1 Tax=Kitasatospora sp. NPDC089797 TaxID=3155298 RepID=UPI0034392E17
MEPELAGFMRQYLNVEMAFSSMERLKTTIGRSNPVWGDDLRRWFTQLFEGRDLTRGEYCELTWVEFGTDEEMYAYLEKIHAFLFLDQGEFPLPPD